MQVLNGRQSGEKTVVSSTFGRTRFHPILSLCGWHDFPSLVLEMKLVFLGVFFYLFFISCKKQSKQEIFPW
jgi:hypothetical protein